MILASEIRRAEYIIDTSGIVDILLTGRKRSNRGRKTDPTKYRLFFLGGLLNVMSRGSFVIEDAHETLTRRIPLDEQFRLGVRRSITTPDGELDVKILAVGDFYEVTRTLTKDLAYGRAAPVEDTEKARRHQVIRDACDAVMDVFDLGFTGTNQAMDATGIWAWHKGRFRKPTDAPATTTGDAPLEAA